MARRHIQAGSGRLATIAGMDIGTLWTPGRIGVNRRILARCGLRTATNIVADGYYYHKGYWR